jgi:hypothetical protein
LDQGPVEKAIIAQAIRQGQPIPNRITNAPQLLVGLELFYLAFLSLNDERSIGFGEGPIPWRAMSEWCVANEVDEDTAADVFYHVKQMDAAYLKRLADKRKAEKGK